MGKKRISSNDNIQLFSKNIGFRLAHIFAMRRLKKIMKKSDKSFQKTGKKILFNMIYGMHGRYIYWELALAKSLQLRGHDVKVLSCGKTFDMCTSEFNVQSVHNKKTCDLCVKYSHEFLDHIKIPYQIYNKYISNEEIKEIKNKVLNLSKKECQSYKYRDINAGLLSENAVLRYFEGDIKPDEKEEEKVLKTELINTIIAINAAEKILKTEKPEVLVTRHLGYSSWGGFAQYFNKNKIRVVEPGDGYKENYIGFDFDNEDIPDKNFNKYYQNFRKKKPLSKTEEKELEFFLKNRVEGKDGDTALYGYGIKDVKSRFSPEKYKKTYSAFPNVAWDSSLLNAHKGFGDVYEWISFIVELFKKNPDYQLLIKIHPSEAFVAKSKNTVSDYILKNHSPLTDNIKIIPPVTDISPYSLFSFIDTGLVYNGTIGLEMALHKIPVIVAGIAHYGKKGFTYDIKSKNELEKIIFNKISKLSEKRLELAKIYGYYYFVKSYIPYDVVFKDSFLKIGWNIKSTDEFKPGMNKYLDKICDYIANGGIYQDW